MGFLAAIPAAIGSLFGGGAATGAGLGAAATGAGLGASSLIPAAAGSAMTGASVAPSALAGLTGGSFLGKMLPAALTGVGAMTGEPVKSVLNLGSSLAQGKDLTLSQLFDIGAKLGGMSGGQGGRQGMPAPPPSPFPPKAIDLTEEANNTPRPVASNFGGYTPTALRLGNIARY